MKSLTFLFTGCLALGALIAQAEQTNWITAAPNFREVDGKLYNVDRSSHFSTFSGDCLKVLSNAVLVQTFTLKPIYQAATRTEIRNDTVNSFRANVPYKQHVGDEKELGPIVVIENYPVSKTGPAVGQELNGRAMKIGTKEQDGQILERWDYGTPHRVARVTP
ncbi:MAG: hypothetical protein ACTHLW_21525 [Verrucomicrobiota bacterium]